MQLRQSRASAVVVQRVPVDEMDWFMEWQRRITVEAEEFEGYQGSDLYPPSDSLHNEWVVVIHFEDQKSLQQWIGSEVRTVLVQKLSKRLGNFNLRVLPRGFGSWFADLALDTDQAAPPSWKMALIVLLGLYPTVMLLTMFAGPYTHGYGLATAMLIGNILSVAILQWLVLPALNKMLAPWIKANSSDQRVLSVGGFFLILACLGGLALLFRQLTG